MSLSHEQALSGDYISGLNQCKLRGLDMLAIKFKADVHDGLIEIPEEYRGKLGNHVKVIARIDEVAEKK